MASTPVNLKLWLFGAVFCFCVSGVCVWVSAQRFIEASDINREASSQEGPSAEATKDRAAARREDGLAWMITSVVVCGVGLGALVYFLVQRPAPSSEPQPQRDLENNS